MTEVIIHDIGAARTLEIVGELRQHLQQHVDFEFTFHRGGYDWELMEHQSYTSIFSFKNPADATAFILKYL